MAMPHVDDLNDGAWEIIEAEMDAGRCWACGCEADQKHKLRCPEREAPTHD